MLAGSSTTPCTPVGSLAVICQGWLGLRGCCWAFRSVMDRRHSEAKQSGHVGLALLSCADLREPLPLSEPQCSHLYDGENPAFLTIW